MKKTQLIDLLTTIRGTIVSFFAITMFVALGAGLFLGIHWIAGAMHSMAAQQFEKGSAHDVEITFPYGLTEDDVAQLQTLNEGDDLTVEASWIAFQEISRNGRKIVMRVGTLPQEVDNFVEVEGTLPQAANEVALEKKSAERFGYALGDTIEFLPDGSTAQAMRYLNGNTYTITALVTSPAYLAANTQTYGMSTAGSGSVDALCWVPAEAFNEMSFLGGKPYVVLRSKALAQLDPFSDEYREAVRDLEARVSGLGDELGSSRLDDIHKLADFVSNEDVKTTLRHAATFADIQTRYEAGLLTDEEYGAQTDALMDELGQSFKDGMGEDARTAEEKAALAALAIPAFGVMGEEGLSQLAEGMDGLVDYSWIVLSRTYNGAMVLMEGYTDVTANLRWSMASLFLVVGILVCYSAVSRIVHEQVTRIGTKKALGFRKAEISRLFLWYAALCVAIGMVVGVLVAVYVVEAILLSSMGSRFVVAASAYANPADVLLIGLLELVLILGATWFAASGVLKRQAVELLAGEAPSSAKKRFYEKWAIWGRMNLLVQTTISNCVNDKRRVVGTLVGVAGCTALIACAVTLNDNVLRSFEHQYANITHYDAISSVITGSDAATKGQARLEAAGMDSAAVLQRSLTLRQPDGSISVATITVPLDDGDFGRLMSVNPVGESSGEDGVWVSEAYHEHLGAQVGDLVTLVDTTGNKTELPIAGFFEWHMLSHQIIVPQRLYEESFGVDAYANKFLVNSNGQGAQEVVKVLRPLSGYGSTRDDYAANKSGFTEFASIARIVVAVYLALAAVMAACVLLNLDFMFVDEKKRELIVLMICGYSLKDAKGYIWHDSVVLTGLGIVCGLVLGGVVGTLTIRSIEQANSSFLHGVSLMAMFVAIGGTALLSAAALMVAMRRIKKIDLTDINRF